MPSRFPQACLRSLPVARPLVFHFHDDAHARSRTEAFEFTLGDALLVARETEHKRKRKPAALEACKD